MSAQASFTPIAAMMLLAGVGIPIMASLNGGLGQQIDNSVAATFVLFLSGLLLATVAVMVTGGLPAAARFAKVPPWAYCGAFFMLFYGLSVTWAAPRIGIGNVVFFVLLGQILAATTIDHFGLLGAMKSAITLRRASGILAIAIGVYLARRPV